MKHYVRYFSTLALLASLLVFCAMASDISVVKPDTHRGMHKSNKDFWDNVRIIPIEITFANSERIEWTFADSKELILGSFQINSSTDLPAKFWEHPEGSYMAIYCDEHKILYILHPWDGKKSTQSQ